MCTASASPNTTPASYFSAARMSRCACRSGASPNPEYFGIGLQPRQPLLATLLEFGFLRFETMARFDGVADAIDKRTAGLPEQVADGGGIGIVPAKRCDAGCTVNSARVLRVPGTWNCKNGLQRPVKLLWIGQDFDF